MASRLQQQQQQRQGQVSGGVASGGGPRSFPPLSDVCRITSDSSIARFYRAIPATLDLFHPELASLPVELNEPYPLPLGWQKFLDLKTGAIYYKKETQKGCDATMSRNRNNPKLDLKLNLSPPRANVNPQVESPNRSGTSSPTSPPSSCVSSEETLRYSNSPEATSMMLVGCPRCLMYVMLSEDNPKCPKCKSTVLLDFLHDNNTKKINKN